MRQLGWAIALVLALAAPAAHAEEGFAQREAAKALVAQGTSLYGEQAYAPALEKFRAAYELFPNPKILFDIGQASSHLGNKVDAANAFQAFLDKTLDAEDIASERTAAREQLGKLAQKLGRIAVTTEPADAQVRIDGALVKDHATFVNPGSHEVTVSRQGYLGATQPLVIHAAENQPLAVVLKPEQKEQPAAPPLVVRDVPAAPQPQPKPAPMAQPAGGLTAHAPSSGHSTASYVLLGTGAAAVVAAVVTGVLASSANSKLGDVVHGRNTTDSADSLRSSVKTDSLISTIATGVGVVALGTGTYLYFSDSPSDSGDATSSAPSGS